MPVPEPGHSEFNGGQSEFNPGHSEFNPSYDHIDDESHRD